jgi:hypothetical protein
VQSGAVIGQIFGDKAKTKIAKSWINFMTGNVNSYMRNLNGPAQLESIETYNNLAASLSEYHTDVQVQKAIVLAEKQKGKIEKASKKALREMQVAEQHLLLLPICTQHMCGGLAHCLKLNLNLIKDILSTSSISMNPICKRHEQLNF